jgi:hypothetical protein
MKKVCMGLATASLFLVHQSWAISLDDIQIWAGSGTNRAALVIEWSVPESLTNSTVPVPVADKTLVWGYRFNGPATGGQMRAAILAADPKLYFVESITIFGAFIESIGYNLNGNGVIGITDGKSTNYISNGILTNATVNVDAARPVNAGDLYWGGLYGPNWETWNAANGDGGFLSSPNRGTNAYWTVTETTYYSAGYHGEWELAQSALDSLSLTNGSWIGLSVTAGEYEPSTNAPYNSHKHAPVSPDGTYVAYVSDTNDFAVRIVSTNDVNSAIPYNDPAAVLGRPTVKFVDYFGDSQVHRRKIVEAPYWTDPSSNAILTKINVGGQITVSMGRKIYDDPTNPYGIDFIVYGNSFFASSDSGADMNDFTDQGLVTIPDGMNAAYGHPTVVSVSQDSTNWFTYPYAPVLVPGNAYRWDDPNHVWTDEQMNETKPLNPALNLASGTTVADALDQYSGSCGGTGYDLKASGLPWIQFIRLTAGTSLEDANFSDYTIIDSISAVHPTVVGDALSISPANLVAGVTNLVFQRPDDLNQTLISLSFDYVSTNARISTVSLSDFSALAPVVGNVSSAYQLQARPVTGATAVTLQADVSLRVGQNYSGTGGDLRVYQWTATNWTSQSFAFNSANHEVLVSGVTNFSAFVVSQIVPPILSTQLATNGFVLQFTTIPNGVHVVERSGDLMNWTPIYTNTPISSHPVIWQDVNSPVDKAFYRVHVDLP